MYILTNHKCVYAVNGIRVTQSLVHSYVFTVIEPVTWYNTSVFA